jgi:hypothetical protein
MPLHPAPGYVLVEVEGKYQHVSAPAKAYEGATSGRVKAIRQEDADYLGIKTNTPTKVYWEELVSGNRGTVFVKVTEIRGFESA